MNWKDWLPRLSWKQSATSRAILLQTTPGVPVWPRRNYEAFAREGYSNSSVVYACVNEIAKAIGGLQWTLQERRGGKWRELDEHPLLSLLQRPNPMQGGGKFFEAVGGVLMISGNAYIERVGPGTGQGRIGRAPRELYVLRPDRVTIVPGSATNLVERYEYRAGGEIVPIPAPLVLHEKLFDPIDDWYGLSPLQVLAKDVDTDNIAKAWNYTLIKKGARPSGALVVPKNLTDAQHARLQKQIDEHAGDEHAGHPMLLEGGMDWKEMGISPRDMDWIESRRMTKHDIAMGYGVPSELIGLKEATYENRREAKRAFYTETVLPIADFLRDDLGNWLVPLYDQRLRFDYDRDAIEALQEDREKVWTRVQTADWLTVNEKRIATGYDEHSDGEVLLVPIGKVPLAEAGHTGADFTHLPADTDKDPGGEHPDEEAGRRPAGKKTAETLREREWKARVLQFLPIERRYISALGGYFTTQRDDVLRRIEAVVPTKARETKDIEEILFELDGQTDKLREVSRPYFEEALKQGGDAVWAEVGASGSFNPASPESRLAIDYQLRALRGIPERVRQRLEQEITAGLSADESPAEIAARINGLYRGLTGARAQTIARTEVARAYNETRWTAMRQLGIDRAEWLTARDEGVRLSPFDHTIDGEVRALGEPFTNGLRFPHDPFGAPGNVINCRCVAIPVGGAR